MHISRGLATRRIRSLFKPTLMEIGTQCGKYAQSKENRETEKCYCVETNPCGMHRV